jgi:small neutral amino acid transporter SnatA (MarC family)
VAELRAATDAARGFPLAVPYLLNPTGIVVLVVVSAETKSVAMFALALGLLAVQVVVNGLDDIGLIHLGGH